MNKLGCVHLVGAGPGDPELLTVKALRLITSAALVVYDRLVAAEILAQLPAGARRVDVGKESGRHAVPQEEINRLLVDLARGGQDVVRLKGGDPFIFGRGGEEAQYLTRHGIPHDIVPGITAASGCAAAVGIPLTHRGLSDGIRLVTGHRQDGLDLDLNFPALADPNCTLVVYMGVGSAARLVRGLKEAGLPGETPVAVVERGTTPAQRLFTATLDTLPDRMRRWAPKPPAVLVIGRVVSLIEERPRIRDPAEAVDA